MKSSLPAIRSRHSRRGFTLFEMVIVLGIIALILGGAIYAGKGFLSSGKMARVDQDFATLTSGLLSYRNNNGFYPSDQQGLKALSEQPTSSPVPRRWTQIMTKVPLDPWDKPYGYRVRGSKIANEPEITSCGPDGQPNTNDDLSSQDKN